jgi:hypothetical protein
MTTRSRARPTAWLGLIAMWLIVLAPLVSQLVVAAREDDPSAVIVCSAVEHTSHGEQATQDDSLAACGYCDLLAAHAAISAPPPSPLILITLVVMAAVPALSTAFTPLGAFASGRPRAPPVFS